MTDLQERLAALSPERRLLLERHMAALRPGASAMPRIPDGPAPLSAEQQRLLPLLRMAPGYPIYTVPLGFQLTGTVDAAALEAALRDVVARHEPLRTAVRESAGHPVQVVGEAPAFHLEAFDLRGTEWVDEEARYLTDAFARRTFDYARGETFRAALVRQTDDSQRLLIGMHHLAADGWSAGVLLRELSTCYAARLAGREPDLPPLPVRFRDWAAWQQRPDAPPLEREEAFWRAELAVAPHALDLPLDGVRPRAQSWAGAKHAFEIPPALADGLRALARREGTTLYTVLATAFALLLRRYAGQDDLVLGTAVANRRRREVEPLVGFFSGLLPLRVRVDGGEAAAEVLRRVRRTVLDVQEHGALPFDRIVEVAGVRRDLARPPLAQAVLAFMEGTGDALSFPGVTIEPLVMEAGTAIFELTLLVEGRGGGLACTLQYATELFDAATIAGMGRHLLALLAALADDPERPVRALPLAADEEATTVRAWSDGGPALGAAECIHRLFQAQAAATPAGVAIAHDGKAVSYAELNRRANRIAHALMARGVGPETRVAVRMHRTAALPAVLLGILKAGGAYVPVDPAHPAARRAAVLRASRATLQVTDTTADDQEGPGDGAEGVPTVAAADLAAARDDDPETAVDAGNLAYVIFTSGSTGGPKGVEIEHRAAAAMLHWVRGQVTDEERAGVLGSTSVSFDVSIAEIFGTLCWGGTLVLVENALAPLPAEPEVRVAAMTPTAAAELVREGRFPPAVRTVMLGGEAVPPGLVQQLRALPQVERVLNLYGPTEDTTYTTCAELDPAAERVPVGRPIDGGRVYVLDEALRHAGAGAPGEVWTAGAGVARGYAGRPGLTAERFVPDPHGAAGARMYRTLDRGRWRADGALDYLGRADAQVKVRGHRIELEEVEQALAQHPAVAGVAAAVREDGAGERRLVGYLVLREGADRPAGAELRAWVRERLPEYMLPGVFTWVPALPRTTSSKLDRRALPDPAAAEDGDEAAFVAPRTELEARLAALWRQVLQVERVGATDDFFDLGGQSILALRLAARVRAELNAEVAVADLLQAPTLGAMARAIEGQGSAVRWPLVALQTFGDRPPLFLAHPAGGHVVCYRGLAALLAHQVPLYGLQPRGAEDGRTPLERIEEMAALYVEAIVRMRPRGPYHLGGWSFGGVLAWEMAQQLTAQGRTVDLVAMFDTAPLTPEAVSYDPGDPAAVVWHTVAGIAGFAAASRVDVESLRGLEPRAQALAMIRGLGLPQLLDDSRVDHVLALTAVRAANLRAQAAYRPRPYAGRITYFRTAGSETADGRSPGQEFWSALARGGVDAHRLEGTHGTLLLEPQVQEIAAILLAATDPGTPG